jgi:hypothetical protein
MNVSFHAATANAARNPEGTASAQSVCPASEKIR